MNDAITREQMYSTTCLSCSRPNVYVSPFPFPKWLNGKWEVRTDLFIDCVSVPKDKVAADEAGEERVHISLFATVRLFLDQHQGLVQRDVFHEVRSVGLGRLKDSSCPGIPAASNEYTAFPGSGRCRNSLSATEQNGHDQRMRETDLDTVDEAIPSTL